MPFTRKYSCKPLGWLGAVSVFVPVFCFPPECSLCAFLSAFWHHFLLPLSQQLFLIHSLFRGIVLSSSVLYGTSFPFPPPSFLFIFSDRIIWFLRVSYFIQAQISTIIPFFVIVKISLFWLLGIVHEFYFENVLEIFETQIFSLLLATLLVF